MVCFTRLVGGWCNRPDAEPLDGESKPKRLENLLFTAGEPACKTQRMERGYVLKYVVATLGYVRR